MRELIAFTGRKRSGKNTGADIVDRIQREQGDVLSYFAFADILKDITHRALNIDRSEADTLKTMHSAKIANGLTLREFYNSLGDSIKSYFGYNAWVDLTLKEIQEVVDSVDIAVCTDLRYPIEEEGLRDFCLQNDIRLTIIKMNNLNIPQRIDNLAEHESEYLTDQINEDYLIEARNPAEIEEQLIPILNGLKNRKETDAA